MSQQLTTVQLWRWKLPLTLYTYNNKLVLSGAIIVDNSMYHFKWLYECLKFRQLMSFGVKECIKLLYRLQSLSPGHKLPWSIWKFLNMLRAQVVGGGTKPDWLGPRHTALLIQPCFHQVPGLFPGYVNVGTNFSICLVLVLVVSSLLPISTT